jgi:hypothetical protein
LTGLETPVSSTESHFSLTTLSNNLEIRLFTWYNNIKGAIMKTINGKLVAGELSNEDNFELSNENDLEYAISPISQSESLQNQKIEDLGFIVNSLDSRINQLERNYNRLHELDEKLTVLSQQIARKILAITVIGAIGMTSLGIWIGLSNKTSMAARTSSNYTATNEIEDR